MIILSRLAASIVLILQVGSSSSFSPVVPTIRFNPCLSPSPSQRSVAANDDESSSLNMNDLRKRMKRQDNQYARLLMEQSKYVEDERPVPESVHIILFHPDTPKQHIHTIEFPKNSGNNLIMAFESGGDCVTFARMLQDLEFVDPTPQETLFEPFAEYSEMAGLSLMIVPKGFELTPPQLNANDDDNDGGELVDDDVTIENDFALKDDYDVDLDAWG